MPVKPSFDALANCYSAIRKSLMTGHSTRFAKATRKLAHDRLPDGLRDRGLIE
jgi:hypothetical protein